jgi:sec-independent protein translocase protein TatA
VEPAEQPGIGQNRGKSATIAKEGGRMEPTGVQLAGFGGLGFPEILIICAVFVLLFGAKKLPELAKGLGEGIKNFKTALKEEEPKVEEKKQA